MVTIFNRSFVRRSLPLLLALFLGLLMAPHAAPLTFATGHAAGPAAGPAGHAASQKVQTAGKAEKATATATASTTTTVISATPRTATAAAAVHTGHSIPAAEHAAKIGPNADAGHEEQIPAGPPVRRAQVTSNTLGSRAPPPSALV
jgi:hypothetical protein